MDALRIGLLSMRVDAKRPHMRDVLVDVDGSADDSALLRFAFSLARQHQAHITGLQVVTLDALIFALPEALLVLADEEANAWRREEGWLALCRTHGVQGSWQVERGVYQAVMARRAVFSDVVVGNLVSGSGSSVNSSSLLGRSLLAEAVPVLLVPDDWQGPAVAERIMIAWNGSLESARALKAALPLLERASSVVLLDGEPAKDDPKKRQGHRRPSLPLREWLQRRGIMVSWRVLDGAGHEPSFVHDVATECKADLVVMGAWGHLRASEWLLGGVTRYMLRHSRVPLLLAH